MSIERAARRDSGVTLIELIVFIVVVSLGLAGVLAVLNLTVLRSADPLLTKQALAAADALLEEVLLKSFADPGGPAEAGRQDWDDVGDFNGYSSPHYYAPTDLATPLLTGYAVAVRVETPAAAIGGVPPAAVRRITVSVTGGGPSVSLVGYRFDYDAP